MQRTEIPVQPPKTEAAQALAPASGPRLIDPSEFKFIGGGAPRGGWLDAATVKTTDEVSAPRGGW